MRSPKFAAYSALHKLQRMAWMFAALTVGAIATDSLTPLPAGAQSNTDDSDGVVAGQPKRHFRVEQPADLGDADALTIYTQILKEMASGYELSGNAVASDYRLWQRYNSAPYRSATHGERFVNNYASPLGEDYGKYEESGGLPPGAVLAKDSFAVTMRGDVFSGPLFLMEKMSAGFDPAARDWRYTMIMPDGSLFGTSQGQGSEKVGFCITCHQAAGDENDHLFFVPDDYRIKVLRIRPTTELSSD